MEDEKDKDDDNAIMVIDPKIIKLASVFLLSLILLIFACIAWFTMSRETGSEGVQMASQGMNYEIVSLSDGNNGLYYDDYHSLVKSSDAMVWQMTAESNMDNYEIAQSGSASNESGSDEEEEIEYGIHPGSQGVISFYVIPKIAHINLDFRFEIIGYLASEDEDTGEIEMTKLDSTAGPARYLNGHILLFEQRTKIGNTYTYSKPILSNEDMLRVMESKSYTGIGTKNQVDIYWVWPNTLSNIVDATSCEKMVVIETPFTSGNDYSAIVTNVETYPEYYLKMDGENSINGSGTNTGNSSGSSNTGNSSGSSNGSGTGGPGEVTRAVIARDYDIYGDYYDQADNDIGMGVNFILLKMSVSENPTSSSGSGE